MKTLTPILISLGIIAVIAIIIKVVTDKQNSTKAGTPGKATATPVESSGNASTDQSTWSANDWYNFNMYTEEEQAALLGARKTRTRYGQ